MRGAMSLSPVCLEPQLSSAAAYQRQSPWQGVCDSSFVPKGWEVLEDMVR
jgi:hypothetical protein